MTFVLFQPWLTAARSSTRSRLPDAAWDTGYIREDHVTIAPGRTSEIMYSYSKACDGCPCHFSTSTAISQNSLP